MASKKISRNFTQGVMNKHFDERLIPDGQYIDAVNVRVGTSDGVNAGVVKPVDGNLQVTSLRSSEGVAISHSAVCVGAIADPKTGYIYSLIHDPAHTHVYKLDMIVGINVNENYNIKYVIESSAVLDGETILKFSANNKITNINIIDQTMYFTDGVNEPRQIMLNMAYPDGTTTESDILVVKAPPASAPSIAPIYVANTESFMRDKTYCFAYRYRYSNGQYSATSQFSQPALYPGMFNLDDDDVTNTGMINTATGVTITYSSGPKNVTDIELLFKYSDSPNIYVISKINKLKSGIGDNQNKTYTFSEEKYVSVLPDYEILRLYDNVPFWAKAQTYMGNRLMYAGYGDGFDMTDKYGLPVNIDYRAALSTASTSRSTAYSKASATYRIQPGSAFKSDCVLNIDMSGIALRTGTVLTIQVIVKHGSFAVLGVAAPTQITPDTLISFSISIQGNYNSVYEFATSTEFSNAIGTPSNININLANKSLGTFTDVFNSLMPDSLSSLVKTYSGVDNIKTPAKIIALQSSNVVGIQIPAVIYQSSPTTFACEYLTIDSATISVRDSLYNTSLHSNRSYQAGIVYMDKYSRSTPAIISENSSFFIDAGKSSNKNVIKVTIPPSQRAPEWATMFKFAIKESAGAYETIYSSFFFKDLSSKFAYFLLSGENARKVSEDGMLVVKSDSYGATKSLVEVKVLEKKDQQADFITIDGKSIPAGTYIKLSTDSISVTDSISFSPGKKIAVTETDWVDINNYLVVPIVKYPTYDDVGNVQIPEGSIIKLNFTSNREGTGECEKRAYSFSKTFRASRNYADFMRFWEGEGIANTLNGGSSIVGDVTACPLKCVYMPGKLVSGIYQPYTEADVTANLAAWKTANADCNNVFYFSVADGKLSLNMMGVRMCNGVLYEDSRKSLVSIDIQVFITGLSLFVFETKPLDIDNGVFYESSQTFSIDTATGDHLCGYVDQDIATGTTGVAILNDFNCISYGNGVESYKIKDSLTGRRIYLGSRAYSTIYTDPKRMDRYADITYSGVYNDDTNVDKLNQFVLGLLNYKHLEDAFGRIMVAVGRKTDVMIIQENKISYVLAGKNLLSDSVDGGSVASVPEVLGTQIARIEEYGTVNPESFCMFGQSMFFTDQRRGLVIRIDGDSYTTDKLDVISALWMKAWFKGKFAANSNKVILGGYDPGNSEFILSFTGDQKPIEEFTAECGTEEMATLNQNDGHFMKTFNVGTGIGTVNLFYRVVSATGTVDLLATGMEAPITIGDGDIGTIEIEKTAIGDKTVFVELLNLEDGKEAIVYFTVGCLDKKPMKIISMVITSNDDVGKSATTFFNYKNGVLQSPVTQDSFTVISGNDTVIKSKETIWSGYAGDSVMPPTGSDMTIGVNGITGGGFDATALKKIYTYLSNDDELLITEFLPLSTEHTPVANDNDGASVGFSTTGDYSVIYIVYDFRIMTMLDISRSDTLGQACCGGLVQSRFINSKTLLNSTRVFYDDDPLGLFPIENGYFSDGNTVMHVDNYARIAVSECVGCNLECGYSVEIVDADKGIYRIKMNTNGVVGLIPIFITIDDYADRTIGVRAIGPTGDIFSEVYSYNYGRLANVGSRDLVVIGKTTGGTCGGVGDYVLPAYEYSLGEFVDQNAEEEISIISGQVPAQAGIAVDGYWLLIPNSSQNDDIITIEIFVLCDTTSLTISSNCGQLLAPVACSKTLEVDPCDELALDQVVYLFSLTFGSVPDIGDLIYADSYGWALVPDGNYRISEGYMSITGGSVQSISVCGEVIGATGFWSSSSPASESLICQSPFDVIYYNDPVMSGTPGVPGVGDVICIDSSLTTKLVDVNGVPAGNYRYDTGYIKIDEDSIVTAVESSCPVAMNSVQGTNVFATPSQAIASAAYSVFYYNGSGAIPEVGDIMYMDAYGQASVASYQGAGYIYLPALLKLARIDSSSYIISINDVA